ncbi:Response regulator c-di-GMP phosphodiesterase, RpfG family, contains REC and HD-GYP domains [Desulfatibacillum alkenivorans DSM 16219]|jgi:response regulator RpfG family c-di-GMP phosphodiesterase|uniref:Response regulator c-di-GMP phosphodiesterase, RpfG family, contains REC and HD-GYP domains n=1 Tax=Desulfatibacillum alkenivorans DSM 16219 TaxID=1121393 RepID=A0A1M6J0C0_9BACT|nr:HD domain-containing phosphohydrolase [Desulfatibacillum alkenivorans]SHJ40144.1 Response regulator c-di-GMP phosphodiesterase, RpfG family, contains REC and HD-GYP domains [Desulfatibacillum alkenivorans DSM 16219]
MNAPKPKYRHTVMLVDDEPGISRAIQRILRREGLNILTAQSGPQALDMLKNRETMISLIISDQKMPEMTGAEFLSQARKIVPDAIRFLLTGYSEMDAIVQAVNQGRIHRYLTKPWQDDDLLLQVRQALEQFELTMENKRLLALTARQNAKLKELNHGLEAKVAERTKEIEQKNLQLSELNKELESSFHNTVRSFASLLQMQAPILAGHGRRVSAMARDMAMEMGLEQNEIANIEIAALLHDMARLDLSKKEGISPANQWSQKDQERYLQHPAEAQAMVRLIGKLDHVGVLIRSHHERCDGKGFPDGLDRFTIPLGSKIIAVANAYDTILYVERLHSEAVADFKKLHPEAKAMSQQLLLEKSAIQYIRKNSDIIFDAQAVDAFLSCLAQKGTAGAREKEVGIDQLKPGMVLSRAIYSAKGQYLLPYDTELSQGYIDRLKKIAERAGLGPIHVLIN